MELAATELQQERDAAEQRARDAVREAQVPPCALFAGQWCVGTQTGQPRSASSTTTLPRFSGLGFRGVGSVFLRLVQERDAAEQRARDAVREAQVPPLGLLHRVVLSV